DERRRTASSVNVQVHILSPAAPPNAAGGRAPAPGLSLMAFSFVFWAAGLTMLIIGLWAKVRLGGYLALSASDSPSAPAILLATGTAVIVWAFLGCFSAATDHRGLLRTYSAFLVAVLLAGLTAGLSALLYRQDIARGFREGLRQGLSAYGEDEGKADALDALQRTLGCCGVESYRDWLASPWALQQNASVPLSCCRARRGCPLSSAGAHGLHTEGCFGKVSAFVSSNMFCIATAALGLAVLQVVGIVLACLLAARIPVSTAPRSLWVQSGERQCGHISPSWARWTAG
uniref:Tetraspanin n=1 Tax=Pavo cristatus TaxID=9049 RepID=A0A8C9LAT0_PAVCR